MKISLFVGDITEAPAQAICTSTNPRLSLMMGTGGTVREKGGYGILRECEALLAMAPRGQMPAGSAHVTSAGTLPYRVVIHCVAGDSTHRSSTAIVRSCVRQALRCADAADCESVAMPVFASGHAHVRFETALEAIVSTLRDTPTRVSEVVIVVRDAERITSALDTIPISSPSPTSA